MLPLFLQTNMIFDSHVVVIPEVADLLIPFQAFISFADFEDCGIASNGLSVI